MPARRSPARCTTCSATGSPCSACTPARWSTVRTRRPEEVARAAEVIRESAHQALQDLREVIGVLRAPVGELAAARRSPTSHELVAESSRAGMQVDAATHGVDRRHRSRHGRAAPPTGSCRKA